MHLRILHACSSFQSSVALGRLPRLENKQAGFKAKARNRGSRFSRTRQVGQRAENASMRAVRLLDESICHTLPKCDEPRLAIPSAHARHHERRSAAHLILVKAPKAGRSHIGPMPQLERIDQYRRRARELRTKADSPHHTAARNALLTLAAEFERLAKA